MVPGYPKSLYSRGTAFSVISAGGQLSTVTIGEGVQFSAVQFRAGVQFSAVPFSAGGQLSAVNIAFHGLLVLQSTASARDSAGGVPL